MTELYKSVQLLAVAWIIIYLRWPHRWMLTLAVVLLLCASFELAPARWIGRAWLAFAHVLGRINTWILMALLFYLVLTPAAFCFRRWRRRTVRDFTAHGDATYFHDVITTITPETFERPW